MNRLRIPALGAALVAAAFAAGCGGGGSSPAGPTTVASAAPIGPGSVAGAGRTMATFTLGVPVDPGASAQGVRRGASFSPSTNGISFTVTPAGGAALPAVTYSTNVYSNYCAVNTDGSRTCSLPIPVPIGASTVAVATFNRAPLATGGFPAGAVQLGTATVSINAAAGQINLVPLTINGYVNRVQLAFVNRPQLGAPGTATVVVTAYDQAGQAIVADAYASPITLAYNDATGHSSINTTTVTSPATAVTIAYDGAFMAQGGVLTATFSPPPNATPSPVPSFTPLPATFWPAMPHANPGTGAFYAEQSTTTTVVASPLPTVSPYPLRTGAIPSPGATGFIREVNLYVTSSPPAGPSGAPAPFNVRNTPLPGVNFVEYRNFPISRVVTNNSGSVLNGVNAANGRLGLYQYAKTGFYTTRSGASLQYAYNNYQTTQWTTPLLEAKLPLTAGDTWSNTRANTSVVSTDTGDLNVYYTYVNETDVYAADGSSTTNASFYVSSTYGGGIDTVARTVRADGSWTETDVFSPASGNYTEVDTVPAPIGGVSTETAVLTYANGSRQTFTTPYNWFPSLAGPLRSSTSAVSGPGPLPAGCNVSLPPGSPGAYAVAEALVVNDPFGGTATQQVSTDYDLPGIGTICTVTTQHTESHLGSIVVQTTTNPTTGAVTGQTFEVATFASPVYTQDATTTDVQVNPTVAQQVAGANRSPQTTSVSGDAGVADPETAMIQRHVAIMTMKAARRRASAAFGGVF